MTGSLKRRKLGLSLPITFRHSASIATSSSVPKGVFIRGEVEVRRGIDVIGQGECW